MLRLRFRTFGYLAFAMLLGVASPAAHAVVTNFAGGDPGEGLDFRGAITHAVNVLGNGAPQFVGDAIFIDDALLAGLVTVTATNAIPNWHAPNYGATPNDDGLEAVMQSIRWTAIGDVNNGMVTADLNGLTPGDTYKVQLLFAEQCCARGFDVFVEGGLVANDFSPQALQQGAGNTTRGAAVIHTFVAGDTTANIVLDGNSAAFGDRNPILNGLTLENLSVQAIENHAQDAPIINSSGAWNQNDHLNRFANGFQAERAVDGVKGDVSQTTFWLGREGQSNQFFIVDLGVETEIKSLGLTNTHNSQFNDRGTRAFQVLASNEVDANNNLVNPQLVVAGNLTSAVGGAVDFDIPTDYFNAATGLQEGTFRYVQFQSLSGTFNANVGLGEIEVFSTDRGGNVAAGKPVVAGSGAWTGGAGVTQSPDWLAGQFSAQNVTDQRVDDLSENVGGSPLTSYWLGRQAVANEFFIIDLGGQFDIDEIVLQNTHNRGSNDRGTENFLIEASADGATFFEVLDGTLANVWNTGNDIPFEEFSAAGGDFSEFRAQYIRFTAETFYGASSGLNEIYLIGQNAIPEPGTALLGLIGLAGLAMRRRRAA